MGRLKLLYGVPLIIATGFFRILSQDWKQEEFKLCRLKKRILCIKEGYFQILIGPTGLPKIKSRTIINLKLHTKGKCQVKVKYLVLVFSLTLIP